VNGNHDVEGKLNGTQLVELDISSGGLTKHGPPTITGASNYVLEIKSNGKVESLLYFFDSMRKGCYGETGWGCVHIDTIQWYIKTSEENEKKFGRVLPSLAFLHIPIPEFMEVCKLIKIKKGIKMIVMEEKKRK
jgi:hypothetical protein